jgi:hypothetical protein
MALFCTFAQVAQSVEQRTENPRVDGSIPPLGTILFLKAWLQQSTKLRYTNAQVAQSVEQRTENPRVDGSIPPLGTTVSYIPKRCVSGISIKSLLRYYFP